MTQTDISDDPKTKERAPVDAVSALEDLTFSARGFMAALDEADVFEKHNISVEEWGVLRTLIGRGQVPMREVARNAGVSRKRLRSVVSALQMKGMVAGGKAAVGEKEARVLSATARAAALRPAISGHLQGVLGAGGERHARAFARLAKALGRMQRSLRRSKAGAKRASRDVDDTDDD